MGLEAIYRPDFKLAKAGVMLPDRQSVAVGQRDLDLDSDGKGNKGQLMTALDGINRRFGKGTMKMASAGLAGDRRAWSMKQERRTPGYTTCVADMPVARA